MLIVDKAAAEAEIMRGIESAGGGEMWTDGPGVPVSVRLSVTTDDGVVSLSKFAAELDGVTYVDAHLGALTMYPLWSYEGSLGIVEESVVTTTTMVTRP